jgi:hypothetical protein
MTPGLAGVGGPLSKRAGNLEAKMANEGRVTPQNLRSATGRQRKDRDARRPGQRRGDPRRPSSVPPQKPRRGKRTLTKRKVALRGIARAEDGTRFAVLRFTDRGRRIVALAPIGGLGKATFERLCNLGAPLVDEASRRDLAKRVQRLVERGPNLLDAATRTGWAGDVFVLPDRVVAAKGGRFPLVHLEETRTERLDRFRVGGRMRGWRRLARLARGNSRFQLLLCLAFVGPLAALLGLEQPAVLLIGEAEQGKTTLLIACGAAWGRHVDANKAAKLGFGMPLNATGNDLEDEALAANHTVLVLDETRAAENGDERALARFMIGLAMRIDSGFEKGRQTASRPRRSASVPVAVTSNKTLGELAALAGVMIDDAHRGRLIEVPLPADGYGAFERLQSVLLNGRALPFGAVQHRG